MNNPFDSSTHRDDEPGKRTRAVSFRRRTAPVDPTDNSTPLECRFSREVYFVIGIWILTGVGFQIALFWSSRVGDFWEMTGALTALFHLPNLFFIFWAERIRVWADEKGLRFRGLGRTRFIKWNEIEDFGWKMAAAGSKSQSSLALLFIRGRRKPKHLSRNLSHFDELLERVAQNATSARVSSWQPLEVRDEGEWPKTFVYRDVSGWTLVATYFGFTFTIFALLFLKSATYGLGPLLSGIRMMWSGLGTGGKVGFVALPFLLCGLQPLLILARYPAIKAARRFRGQRIVATREGLSFERDGQDVFVAWNDIERFELETLPGHFQVPLCVVHTRRDRYEFHSGIQKGRELMALIAYRASNASNSTWSYAVGGSEDILGGASSLWRGGVFGVGARIHHYRTRTNRIMLLFGAIMIVPLPYFAVYGRFVHGVFTPPDLGDRIMCAIFIALLLPTTLWGTLAYWFSAVEVDEGGLKQRGVWGERHLKWSEIERAKYNGAWLEVRGNKATLRIGPVAESPHLCEEIESRSEIKIQRSKDFQLGN